MLAHHVERRLHEQAALPLAASCSAAHADDRQNIVLPIAARESPDLGAPRHGSSENVILRRWPSTNAPGVAGTAAADPEKTALVWHAQRITYGELDRAGQPAGTGARAPAASGRDAPVATVLGNRPEWVEVALASARLGARLVPASWRSTTDELDYLLRDSGAVLLVSEPGARADDLGPTLHVGDEYERALAEHSDAAIPGATTPDFVATRVYTSGTTGRPKAIVRPVSAGPWTHGARPNTSLLDFWGLTGADEVNLTCLPLHHGAGNGYALQALACAQTVVVMERFDADALLRLIEAERVTYMNMVPTQFVRIAALEPERARPLRPVVDEARAPRVGALPDTCEAGHVRPVRPDHLGDVRRYGGAGDDRVAR